MKNQKQACFSNNIITRQSVMACATAVFLTFSYANQVAAETWSKYATMADDPNSGKDVINSGNSVAVPSSIKELAGKAIDYDHYKSYVTTGRPEDRSKMFLLYNVGTGKFLNVGSYWGTHATLSDVPRPFWLQRRNETPQAGQWSYMRYPESPTKTNNFKNDFFMQTTLKVGNIEGNVRSHVLYKHIRVVNIADGSVVRTIKADYQANGDSFLDSLDIDFDTQRIEAEIDMSGCQVTYNGGGSSGGLLECILSLGDKIDDWSNDYNTIHIYGSKTSSGDCELRVNCFDTKYSEATHKTTVNLKKTADSDIATIVVAKGSVKVNGVECCPAVAEDAYDSPIKPFLSLGDLQIGSTQGTTRTNATYNYVKVVKTITNTESVPAIEEGYVNQGEAFSAKIDKIDFANGGSLKTEINLSTCKTENNDYNIFSVGNEINLFGNTQKGGTQSNIHVYFNGSTNKLIAYAVDGSVTKYDEFTYENACDKSKNVIVELSSAGLKINDEVAFNADNRIVNNLLTTYSSQLYIGSCEGNYRSYATYVSCNATKQKRTTTKENDINYTKDANQKFKVNLEGNLKTKPIVATIDVSGCTQTKENILSVGTNIETWGTASVTPTPYNIHFYYTKSEGKLYIDVATNTTGYTGSGYPYLQTSIDHSADKELTIGLSEEGIRVDGTLVDIEGVQVLNGNKNAAKAVLAYLTESATSFSVGSEEGDHHANNATYKKLAWTETVSVANTETTTYFENKEAKGEKLKEQLSSLSFADGDYIEADIDLSTCTTALENIFSIGDNIDAWGLSEKANNIHIYLRNTNWTENNVYVVYVNKDHSDDFKRAFTVSRDDNGKAIMHLKLSKDGLEINGKDMYPAINPMPTILYDANKVGDIVRFKQLSGGDKIFELGDDYKYVIADDDDQNAHGVYVANSNYIYTTESRTDKTMPLFITSKFKQERTSNGNEGVYFSWSPYLENAHNWGSIGVFADRNLPQKEITTTEAINCSQWFFEPVSGKTNTYRVYLKMKDVKVPERNGKEQKFKTISGTQNFYLQAIDEHILGNSMENYGGGYEEITDNDYDGVEALNTLPDTAKYAEWKVFDINEYYQLFKAENTEMSQMLDLTYRLYDPDFARESMELSHWKMDDGLTGKIRIGYDEFSKKTLDDTDYTDDEGHKNLTENHEQKDTGNAQYQIVSKRTSNHARNMGVDVKDGSGRFYQEVTLTYPGWYAIKCGGITTCGSSLFVRYGSDTVEQPLHQLTKSEYQTLNKTSNVAWPFDYIDGSHGMPMYNALVAMNESSVSNSETFSDYKGFYDKFNNQVVFFVDPDILAANKNEMQVTFGINVNPTNGGGIDLLSDDAESQSEEYETSVSWTVFDNFHLLFGGNDGEPYLILDEDDENVDHIDNTIHKYRSGEFDGKTINKKLLLHRTFTKDSWNTIMLPVGLTKEQYQSAFGESPLAELSKLTDTEIQFQTVTATSKYMDGQYDDVDYWMKPMTPYIIKSTVANGNSTEEYTAHLYTWASNGEDYLEKPIGENGTPYFTIDNINMVEGIVKSQDVDQASASTFGSKWDFAHMTANIDGTDYPYVMKGQVVENTSSMTAYGHLAKNFTTISGSKQLKEGRAPMADSYTMSGNKLVYLSKGAASKGFRCWFQYNDGQSSAKPTLVLDGVDMTTGIDDITFSDEGITPIDQYRNGIYTIDGVFVSSDTSRISKLPKGIYIVNGKKIVNE